jgi:hypothetical protein
MRAVLFDLGRGPTLGYFDRGLFHTAPGDESWDRVLIHRWRYADDNPGEQVDR